MQYLQRSTKQEVLQLQGNWVISHYMEKRSHYSRIQRCSNYPPIQTERESISLWQSSWQLFIVFCWEGLCKNPTESIEWIPWTVRAFTGKLMCIQKGQRNNWHDLHSKTASVEMLGTECWPLHYLCRPYHSIWHSQSWRTFKSMAKFGCLAKFIAIVGQFHDGMLASVQIDGEFSEPFPVANGVKHGCVLASPLFSLMFICNVHRCFPGWWKKYTYKFSFRWEPFQPEKFAS